MSTAPLKRTSPAPAATGDPRITLERLFAAFTRMDGSAMQTCYADQARFEDELFSLQGASPIGGMWRMLFDHVRRRGRMVWQLDVLEVNVKASMGQAHWKVQYLVEDRPVQMQVHSQFTFDSNGLIRRQRDEWNFGQWARQALGWRGWLFGWTEAFRNRYSRAQTDRLRRFVAVL